jgi:hypothetical protein
MDGHRSMTPHKIVVGPVDKGLKENRIAFNIDNDSFETFINMCQFRGRVMRKRGTSLLNRLSRYINTVLTPSYTDFPTIVVDGNRDINLITGFNLESTSSLIPGTIVLTDTNTLIVFTDPLGDGNLVGNNMPPSSGTVNYSTGLVHFNSAGAMGDLISGNFQYYPGLPVLGLEFLNLNRSVFTGTLAFDDVYAYNISPFFPYTIYDVSFYKNSNIAYAGYMQKLNPTRVTWNGQNYQQYQSVNYQGAFWVTNSVRSPAILTNVGMQYAPAATITSGGGTLPITVTNPQQITVNITPSSPLEQGDFVFFNEWVGATDAASQSLNLQTGYVTAAIPGLGFTTVIIRFPLTTVITLGNYTPGIIQYLTNRSDDTLDCIRWYDGDPTNGANPPILTAGFGWVNFMPPLSRDVFSISQLPEAIYYLVGAALIQNFKDRLCFFGPIIQSSNGSKFYLQDTCIYSQNGTVYYTSSFNGDPSLPTTVFTPILVPTNQTASPSAWWEDQTGFGGFITAGIDLPIRTAEKNEDVLIVGAPNTQMRFVYTGNDLLPFEFYLIDDDLSTDSTFSAINMGFGIMTRGDRGIIITNQRESNRIDLEIPDEIFEINLQNNGSERFSGQRDYLSEWIYYTYNSNQSTALYPSQTLLYNYREKTWAIFKESYTTYGQFIRRTGMTWATVGQRYPTWNSWNVPWNSSTATVSSAQVIAGNQQGFVLVREDAIKGGTAEGTSLFIQAFSGITITSPDHGLNTNDYIIISGCMGITGLNGNIFSVQNITENTFDLNPAPSTSGAYIGGGLITRMYVPYIQTKQFPTFWNTARKTRIGVQRYLFTTTANAQVQLLIFLSQNNASAYNIGPIWPQDNSINNSLIYSTILFTCPESTNLGLTPKNVSLMMITNDSGSSPQEQIWHRMNTSLIGDTVQIGITMSDDQMRDPGLNNQFAEIELHGFTLDVYPSQMLC